METKRFEVQSSEFKAQSSSSPRSAAHPAYALRRHLGYWELVFEGRTAILKHEQGIFYVSYLLHHPPDEPLHGVALALAVRQLYGKPNDEAQIVQQRAMGLDDAESFRSLRQKQKELETILDDPDEIEPVKAEVTRELIEIYEFQRKHPWRTRDSAQKTVRAINVAIKRFQVHLLAPVASHGKLHPVMKRFAAHLDKYLVVPSSRGGYRRHPRFADILAGCFGYRPPAGVVWEK
jgi:hypothetical protein